MWVVGAIAPMVDEIRERGMSDIGVKMFVYMLLLANRPMRRLLVLFNIEGFNPPSSLKNSPTTEALSRLCRLRRRAGEVGAGDRRYWSKSVSVFPSEFQLPAMFKLAAVGTIWSSIIAK